MEAKTSSTTSMQRAFLFVNRSTACLTAIITAGRIIYRKKVRTTDTATSPLDEARARTERVTFKIKEATANKVVDSDPIISCHSTIDLTMARPTTPLKNSAPHHQCDHFSSAAKSAPPKTTQITTNHQLKGKCHHRRFFKLQHAQLT